MMTLFNRYIARMRVDHAVLGNQNLFIMILSYLEGEDILAVSQVCYYFKATVASTPALEVRMLKFSLRRSNERIQQLTEGESESAASLPVMQFHQPRLQGFFPAARVKQKTKWDNFIEHFYVYAKEQGFEVHKREDFRTRFEWERYQEKLNVFYDSYVGHIKRMREPVPEQEKRCQIKQRLTKRVENIKSDIGVTFHFLTNYRFFKAGKDTQTG